MRTKITISITVLVVMVILAIIVFSCDKSPKTVSVLKVDTSDRPVDSTSTTNAPLKTTNTCTCLTARPIGCACARKVIHNGVSRDFTINWTSCSACKGTLPSNSTGIMCFGEDCKINLQLNDLPDCLQDCFGRIGCVNCKVTCNGGAYSLQFISGDGTQQVTITGDPHIEVKCTSPSGIDFVCEGDIVYTN